MCEDAIGGLLTRGNAHVDPGPYTRAVARAAQSLGARIASAEAVGLRRDGARATHVDSDAGEHPLDGLVLAPGAWSEGPFGWLGLPAMTTPVKGELVLARVDSGAPAADLSWGPVGVYAAGPDRVLLGGTEDDAGLDSNATDDGRERVLSGVARLLPGLGEPDVLEHWAGLRPVSPDGLPIVGIAPGWSNVCLAGGSGRKGMLLRTRTGPRGGRAPARWRDVAADRAVRSGPGGAQVTSATNVPPLARNAAFRTECTGCGAVFEQGFVPFCPACGAMTDVSYDLDAVVLRDSPNPYERFVDLLPVRDPRLLPRNARFTPLVHSRELGAQLGLPHVYLKDETGLPTGTTKDRMAAIALPYLYECGVRGFTTSSTGNSSSAYARAIGQIPELRMWVFTAEAFRERLSLAGSDQAVDVVLEDATFVEAFAAAGRFADEHGLTSERGFFNPGRREGLKLAWLEATEQLSRPIDWYVQAISSAMGVYGVYNAARQLTALGRTERIPRLLCVQQETCAPMVTAFRAGAERIRPEDIVARPTGIAAAIMRGDPTRTYPHIRRIVLDSGGTFASVGEAEIRSACSALERSESIYPCFAAAAAFAGLVKARAEGTIGPDDTVLVNVTGANRPGTPPGASTLRLRRDAGGAWDFSALLPLE